MKTCLLLTSPDGKQMPTNQSNYDLLVEFIDYFKLTTQFVKIEDESKMLDIPQIASIFCDSNYHSNVEFISKASVNTCPTPQESGNSSSYIRKKIKEQFVKNRVITF